VICCFSALNLCTCVGILSGTMEVSTTFSDMDDETLRGLKREQAIQEKIKEADRKREEEQEQKRLDLERKREEVERKEKELVQRQLNASSAQARQRAKKKAEQDRLDARREQKIKEDHERWLKKSNAEIQMKMEKFRKEDERVEREFDQARARNFKRDEELRQEKIEVVRLNAELEERRAERQTERQTRREIRELHVIDKIKTEAREELESFLMHPAPVPLKQVLAGRTRPVPRVTELLAAHKDQREDMDILENADLQMRALLKNQTLSEYVREFRKRAEDSKIRAPEPAEGDLGRARAKGRKGSSSPTARGSTSKGRSASPSKPAWKTR